MFLMISTEKCEDALGMHSYEIPDKAITASSSYNVDSVGPENASVLISNNVRKTGSILERVVKRFVKFESNP
ncbi:discoidin domain-containing receptor a-like [Plakobranchus ocellatus]|uniref:Discoidin domain-containing receptor a-like n=1 Tax=Plakobranchus ocellatus TaxID=259542 RepID=A0AAV4DZA0_9GAST|nr:discoidin domain-containing receptor a-like [Plakobranchus ocellatus]